jgi:hypothetical protein
LRARVFSPSSDPAFAIPDSSLASCIKAYSPSIFNGLKPLANAYARACGHRKVGLKYDDLIIEERDDVAKVRRLRAHRVGR